MKKTILSLFLSVLTITQTSFGLEPNAMLITFADSSKTGQVIKVVKAGDSRIFFDCSVDGSSEPQDCYEITRISAKKFEVNKDKLKTLKLTTTKHLFEGAGAMVGGVVGGVFGLAASSDGANHVFGLVAIVFIAAGAYIGYRIGDWITGKEFSDLQTIAIRTTIMDPRILLENVYEPIKLETTIQEYHQYLQVASEALTKK